MITIVDQLLAHPGAKDLRFDTLVASPSAESSEDKKVQVIAQELIGYMPSLRGKPSREIVEHFDEYYTSHIRDVISFARRNFIYTFGEQIPLLDTPEELQGRVSNWIKKNEVLEHLVIYLPLTNFLPPELADLHQLKTLNLCSTRISFFPHFLKTMPKLEEIWMDSHERPPRMPHAPYHFRVTHGSALRDNP